MSIFSKVKMTKPKSNIFPMAPERKMSFKMGELTPHFVMDCVPGDHIQLSTSVLLRFVPLIAPIMHQVSLYQHFYFVPNRILWPNWESFITGGEDGFDVTVAPYFNYNPEDHPVGSLSDYLGLPTVETGESVEVQVGAFVHAGYNKIYNEFYRDQNLIDPIEDELVDGENSIGDFQTIRKRAWEHDYFTSALPWAQKGAAATIPLGTEATVITNRVLTVN